MSSLEHERMVEELMASTPVINVESIERTLNIGKVSKRIRVIQYTYRVDDKLHRIDGPAKYNQYLVYENGVLISDHQNNYGYYINGNKVSKAYFKKKYGCE